MTLYDQFNGLVEAHRECGLVFNQRAEYANMPQNGANWLFFPVWDRAMCQQVFRNHFLAQINNYKVLLEAASAILHVNGNDGRPFSQGDIDQYDRLSRFRLMSALNAYEALGGKTNEIIPHIRAVDVTEDNFLPLLMMQIEANIMLARSNCEVMTAVTVMANEDGDRSQVRSSIMQRAQKDYAFHYETAASQMYQVDDMFTFGLKMPRARL